MKSALYLIHSVEIRGIRVVWTYHLNKITILVFVTILILVLMIIILLLIRVLLFVKNENIVFNNNYKNFYEKADQVKDRLTR